MQPAGITAAQRVDVVYDVLLTSYLGHVYSDTVKLAYLGLMLSRKPWGCRKAMLTPTGLRIGTHFI
jgi:hypothetical protein